MRIIIVLISVAIGFQVSGMRTLELDESVTHTIRVSDKRPCTIMFPAVGGIESIQGSNITKNPQYPAGYFVEYIPKSNFFSLKATSSKPGTGYVNVVYQRKIISLKLVYAPKVKNSDNSVIFKRRDGDSLSRGNGGTALVTPSRLIALIDKSKSYKLLADHRPEALAGVDYRRLMQVSSFPKFDVIVDEAWRYDRYDTIIFKLVLKNKTKRRLVLDTRSFAVRVGRTLYPASIVQCSQFLPPSASTLAYVGITGNPTGGRANLSLENLFKFLCTETEESAVKGKTILIAAVNSLGKEMTLEQLEDAGKKITLAESYDPGLKPVAERFREKINSMIREKRLKEKLRSVKRKLDELRGDDR